MEILTLISLPSLLTTRQRVCFIAFGNDVAVKEMGVLHQSAYSYTVAVNCLKTKLGDFGQSETF